MSLALDKLVDKFAGPVKGPGRQPYGVLQDEAQVMLDVVLEGRLGRILAGEADAHAQAILDKYVSLMQIAVRSYADFYPRAKVRYAGWTRSGITWIYPVGGDGEHDATCIFCRESISTVGSGPHRLPAAFINKLKVHTAECAMKMLAGDSEHMKGPRYSETRIRSRHVTRRRRQAIGY